MNKSCKVLVIWLIMRFVVIRKLKFAISSLAFDIRMFGGRPPIMWFWGVSMDPTER